MSRGHVSEASAPTRTEATGPATFFQKAYAVFLRAKQGSDSPIDRWYAIGGYTIRLRLADAALVPVMTPALDHLATEPQSTPDLTVCLWDSVSTGTTMPSPPWSSEDYRERSEIRGYNQDGFRTAFEIGSNFLSMLDTERNVALFWTRDATQLPYYVSGAPLRTIFHWWMGDHGRRLIHAGAVGKPEGGVLLVGKGGSGKSTTALACLDSDLVYASDDYCLLQTEPEPYAHSLYSSGKFGADGLDRLPQLQPAISNPDKLDTEKALLFLHEHYPEKLASGFRIRAVLMPRVTGGNDTTLTQASPMESLRALAPSTIFQLSGAGHAAFRDMAAFAKQTPAYHLNLGTDIPRIPGVISDFLSRS